MEKINLTDLVKNEILRRVKEERNNPYTMLQRKANWNGHILHRICFLKYVLKGMVYGRTEVTGRGGRRRNKQQDEIKETRGCWELKEGTLDGTPRRTYFEKCYGPVVRQTTERMNKYQLVK